MYRLDLVIGPNGAGKSTFVRLTLTDEVSDSPFVNADEIARLRWPHDAEGHSYEAAEVAARTRESLISERRSFIAETVFSHPSKLDLIRDARSAGYIVVLHLLLVPEPLSVERVAHRVRSGGHSVPDVKIRERYRRMWPLVVDAIGLATSASVYDSSRRSGPRLVAQFERGIVVSDASWPAWTPEALTSSWPG
jgi:predicted ABC-type ATPase